MGFGKPRSSGVSVFSKMVSAEAESGEKKRQTEERSVFRSFSPTEVRKKRNGKAIYIFSGPELEGNCEILYVFSAPKFSRPTIPPNRLESVSEGSQDEIQRHFVLRTSLRSLSARDFFGPPLFMEMR